jgi:aspartyl aminopeptidase
MEQHLIETILTRKLNRRIPNLAIHLQTAAEREAFKVNKEVRIEIPTSPSLISNANAVLTSLLSPL